MKRLMKIFSQFFIFCSLKPTSGLDRTNEKGGFGVGRNLLSDTESRLYLAFQS